MYLATPQKKQTKTCRANPNNYNYPRHWPVQTPFPCAARVFLVMNASSLSQTWTEKGNKLLPSRSDSERLMNAEQVWTGIRYMGFSMYRYGFDRNKILSWDGPEQVRTTIPRPRNSERHFPNTWGILRYSWFWHTNSIQFFGFCVSK